MQTIFSIAVDALAYGMVLFVISIGLSVTMGLMRVVNLAHGAFAMIGGYIASYAAQSISASATARPSLLAVVGTIVIAIPLERLLYRRIYGAAGADAGADDHRHHLLHHRHRQLCLRPDAEDDPAAGRAAGLGRSRLPLDRHPSALRHRLRPRRRRRRSGTRSRRRPSASSCAPRSTTPPWRPRSACAPRSSMRSASPSRSGLRRFGGVVGAELLPVEPYYALRYMVTFLVVVSVGGAGSIPGALARLPAARRHRHDRPLSDAGIRRVLLLPRGHRHRLRLPARPRRTGTSA